MNTQMSLRAAYVAAAAIFLTCASFASAADFSGGANGVGLSRAPSEFQSVRITGPDGFSSVSDAGSLQALNGGPLVDGLYKYELIATRCVSLGWAEIDAATRDNAANGRAADAQPSSCREVVVDSGSFRIVNGAVPDSTLVEE